MDPLTILQRWWQDLNKTTLSNPNPNPNPNPILLSLLFFLCLFYLFKITRSSKLNLPPSPWKLPIIGNLHQLSANLHRSLQTLSEKYGPVVLIHMGSTPTLIVSSAEIGKEIMRTQDAFAYRPQTKAGDALFYGYCDIAFCPFGDYWRQAKKICVQEILSQRRVQAFQFVREEEVAYMVEKIRLSILNGTSVDLTEMFATISNNIISRSALGRVYEGEGDKSFAELSKIAMDLIGAFCFKDMIPVLGWMDDLTGLNAKLESTCEALHNFLDQVIEEHQVSKSNGDKTDFVDILLQLQKDGSFDIELTQENIKAILLDMFIGGTDTTATTMEWAMAELVKNPSIMKKAQAEVRRVVGEKTKIDETDINQMEYFKCIVKEILRLHVPVIITRGTSASAKLEGYDIPPNTTIFINSWAIQRDPKLWDSPEEFIPERFASNSIDFIGQHSQYIPFGAGKRGCPGISFATIETEYVLANLLCWFDWKLPDGARCEDLDMSDVFVLVIRKKIPLRLVPAMPAFF